MSRPRVVAVAPGSPADRAGLAPGDEIAAVAGEAPRDVIAFRLLADEADLELEVVRGGLQATVLVDKQAGEPLGAELSSPLFDAVRTCDNHCEFCFIHQLPPGLRPSLYVKDDDYRLSFLYGNFTTLTRFTEADLERVVDEGLGPLYVSIHATDPEVRARMLRNRRGATSLRWLRALLERGVEVLGQIVVCPGVNDARVLEDTMVGILDEYPGLAAVAVVPLGVSRWSREPALRPHTPDEARAVVRCVEEWQATFLEVLARRVVFAADEYYVLSGLAFPPADHYEGFPLHEDGVGMARLLAEQWHARRGAAPGEPAGEDPSPWRGGFFSWVDGAPADGYRALRAPSTGGMPADGDPRPVGVVTGTYGAVALGPLVDDIGRDDVRLVTVENRFFGGNIAVTGLLAGEDVAAALAGEPEGDRYLLPDVCLSNGAFLDGVTTGELPRAVEVVATDGASLRKALEVATPCPTP